MKKPILAIMLAYSGLFLLSCASKSHNTNYLASNFVKSTALASNFIKRQSITTVDHRTYPAKNPKIVALFESHSKPLSPYRIIGFAKVSKYNLLGFKRQDQTVQNMMKELAASVGGDALIDIGYNNDQLEGKVIQFQKILI